ncbi:hypothetical protein NGRA_1929 [Nosema granulosis]|uniref:Uncharacterized protein n=1 Tax=Nosema granulosis TaxID=83296 RepID=A0A9P6KYX3_9MICR|nr:hypothetical protein NGRA_1929 [Nosema granulosis]
MNNEEHKKEIASENSGDKNFREKHVGDEEHVGDEDHVGDEEYVGDEDHVGDEEYVGEEIYSVNFDNNLIVYGGNLHNCTLFNIENGCPEGLIEGFSDSVVFCKQVENNLILVCTIDGTISLLTKEEIVTSEKIEEDITFVDVLPEKILIGGSSGTVYIFTPDLSSHNVYLGHFSDIHKIYYANNTVYALSDDQFIAFDEYSYQQKYRKNLKCATVFEPIPGTDIFCVGKEGEIIILKNGFLLNKFVVDGTPECIVFAEDQFIVGGSFPYLVLINTKMNMREYRLRLDIEGTTKIQRIGPHKIAISTMCGLVGMGDIRKDDSFVFTSSNVESVFDFQFVEDKFFVGGALGFDVVGLSQN